MRWRGGSSERDGVEEGGSRERDGWRRGEQRERERGGMGGAEKEMGWVGGAERDGVGEFWRKRFETMWGRGRERRGSLYRLY